MRISPALVVVLLFLCTSNAAAQFYIFKPRAKPAADHIGKLELGPFAPSAGKISVRVIPADRHVEPPRLPPRTKDKAKTAPHQQTSSRALYDCAAVRWYAKNFTPAQLEKLAKSFGHTITEADRRAAAACFT